jgi:hypothetical protein
MKKVRVQQSCRWKRKQQKMKTNITPSPAHPPVITLTEEENITREYQEKYVKEVLAELCGGEMSLDEAAKNITDLVAGKIDAVEHFCH